MKTVTSRLLAFLVILAFPVTALADTITDQVVNPTVQINRNCSGTIIKSDRDEVNGRVETLILTAKHCIKNVGDAVDVFIPDYNKDGRRFREQLLHGKVKGKHFKFDLAVIELVDIDTLYTAVAKLAPADYVLERFSPVVASGYPLALTLVVSDGKFSQRVVVPGAPYREEVLVSAVAIAGGSSGGGLYTISGSDYLLIGVTSMGAQQFPYGLFVPFDHIAQYVAPMLKPTDMAAGGPK
jgi:S1-C subfamily serine protease